MVFANFRREANQNGVFYFPYSYFRKTLSKFIAEHHELELVTMSAYDSGSYGTLGYFVVFKEKSHEENIAA